MSVHTDESLADRLVKFYRSYYDEEVSQLAQAYPKDQRSLYIEYDDLYRWDSGVALDWEDDPAQMREYAEEALRMYDLPADIDLSGAHVRLTDSTGALERVPVAGLDSDHIGKLVAVSGQLAKVTGVGHRLSEAAYECQRCGTMSYISQGRTNINEPHECKGCERQGPFVVNLNQSVIVDQRKLKLEEPPGERTTASGQDALVFVEDDLCHHGGTNGLADHAGEQVTIIGTYNLDRSDFEGRNARPEAGGWVEGHAVVFEETDFGSIEIDEHKDEFMELASRPDAIDLCKQSIAPELMTEGDEELETAMEAAVAWLFNSYRVDPPDMGTFRGDLHFGLIGDPGRGKSTLLAQLAELAPKCEFRSGTGLTKVGLCVTGDTMIQTNDGLKEIGSVARDAIPESVEEDTRVPFEIGLPSYDEETGEIVDSTTSHIWRMPPKECREITTRAGKSLSATLQTPVLTCGEGGISWKSVQEVEPGEYVATPASGVGGGKEVSTLPYFDFDNEMFDLSDDSRERIRTRLSEEFGSLREASRQLGLSEDDVYTILSHHNVSNQKLQTMLNSIGLSITDMEIESMELRHGSPMDLPTAFDDDLMWLLGMVFGDGSLKLNAREMGCGVIRVSNGDREILREAQRIFAEKFGIEPGIEQSGDRVPEIRIHRATIARFFENAGMAQANEKAKLGLDDRLTTASGATAFIRGLYDADGWVEASSSPSTVGFTTISETLARQVVLMLQNEGIKANMRTRPAPAPSELKSGQQIIGRSDRHMVEIRGSGIAQFAEKIGFESSSKQEALASLSSINHRSDRIPVGDLLDSLPTPTGKHGLYFRRGSHPGRDRAREIIQDEDLGDAERLIRGAVEADLRWEEVTGVEDLGECEVYDLTVPETHNFVANGIVTHNTAGAFQEEFAGKSEWTLEPGVLPRANGGHCIIDEVDDVVDEKTKAIHDALEGEQMVKVDKGGISANLPTRTALLASGNPTHGRFEKHEPIPEQIDLDPALVSRMDVLLAIQDIPDPGYDEGVAQHVLDSYDEMSRAQLAEMGRGEMPAEMEATDRAVPKEVFRAWVAYAREEVFPTLTDEAKATLKEFYLDVRDLNGAHSGSGSGDDPIPATPRTLEAGIRLATAFARVELSDTVEIHHAERAISISKKVVGLNFDPDSGLFDAGRIDTGKPKSQKDRIDSIKAALPKKGEGEDALSPEEIAGIIGEDVEKVEKQLESFYRDGEVYCPSNGVYLRT
jgi:DNA replicative helicase MCM subunit Mcm2 (Cdc46/Mcm family)